MRLRIAARKSDLARLQAYTVGEKIQTLHPQIEIEYQFKESLGDVNLTDPLWKAPEKGLFTEDFYADLVEKRADLVVHSWKDLPILEKPLTHIAATLERADARDVLLFKHTSKDRPDLTILSSSPRRAYNLTPFFSWSLPWAPRSVTTESVRGNIPTRIRKLIEGPADGIIVAKAALDRLCSSHQQEFAEVRNLLKGFLQQLEFQVIPYSVNPPCAGQGALAIEILRENLELKKILDSVNCASTFQAVEEERRILKNFGGGCHQKIGVWIQQRDHGKIQILKGLTDQGEVLNVATLKPLASAPKIPSNDLITMNGEGSQSRREIAGDEPPEKGWIVARADGLPRNWQALDRFIWSAGTKTWRKLAERGVWVHGTFDGLGEEEIHLPFLEKEPNWVKLTHTRALERKYPQLATYEVTHTLPEQKPQGQMYFWQSPDHFELFLARFPEIRNACHACGPGATYPRLLEKIDPTRVFAFFDESDWRRQCQI